MPVEERSLTSGVFLEATNSPEIGFAYQLHSGLGGHGKNFTCQRRCEVFGVTTEMKRHIVCWREKPVGEPCARNPHARFDEREVETEYGEASEAPTTERVGNR